MTNIIHLDKEYQVFFSEIKEQLKTRQTRAALAVNKELIEFYWYLGNQILEKQKTAKWGSKLIEQLSKDLRNEFKGMGGFSSSNIKYMRQFASLYDHAAISQQAVGQLPWGHIILLIQKFKNHEIREWYAQQAIVHGWSRAVLDMQVETKLYERQANNEKKLSNFKQLLPAPQSDMAQGMLKDPYNFDFLTITKDAKEQELEGGLTKHITKFLLELGAGFAFLGNQYPIKIGKKERSIDMLFFNVKLRAFVVVELKAREFRPEDTGKLNYYLAAVDDILRHPDDNPTIGILLCRSKEKIDVEYALRGVTTPMGVSEYQLTKAIPENLKSELPSIEELEAEFSKKR